MDSQERDEEQGDGAGLSQLDRFIVSLQSCSSTVASPDTVFVTLFRTAVERAICGVHKFTSDLWGPPGSCPGTSSFQFVYSASF